MKIRPLIRIIGVGILHDAVGSDDILYQVVIGNVASLIKERKKDAGNVGYYRADSQ